MDTFNDVELMFSPQTDSATVFQLFEASQEYNNEDDIFLETALFPRFQDADASFFDANPFNVDAVMSTSSNLSPFAATSYLTTGTTGRFEELTVDKSETSSNVPRPDKSLGLNSGEGTPTQSADIPPLTGSSELDLAQQSTLQPTLSLVISYGLSEKKR